MHKEISKLIESREQGSCLDIPMREATKNLLLENQKMNRDLAIIHEHTNLAEDNSKDTFIDAVKMIRKRSEKYENIKLTAGPLYKEVLEES